MKSPPPEPFILETNPIITIIKDPCRVTPYTPQGMNSPLRIRADITKKYKTGGKQS